MLLALPPLAMFLESACVPYEPQIPEVAVYCLEDSDCDGNLKCVAQFCQRSGRWEPTADGESAEPPVVERKAPVDPSNPPAIPDVKFGSYYALLIGNDAYEHLAPLRTARADATELSRLLRSAYGFHVDVLENARREDVMSSLARYRRTLGRSDNLLIYYAGHGWNDEEAQEAYWLPVDARENDETNWISNASITTMLRAMKAKHVLVIADSCYSGTLMRGARMGSRERRYIGRLAKKRSRTALTSGGNEPVPDGWGKHSIFANELFRALSANTAVLDATTLYVKIKGPVMLNSRQTPQYGDVHLAGHDDGDFLFVRSREASEP